jgi:hypothetical protein
MAEEASNERYTGSGTEGRPQPRPRPHSLRRLPSLGAFLESAPQPAPVERGSPRASADEDIRILDELAGLRRDANRELA